MYAGFGMTRIGSCGKRGSGRRRPRVIGRAVGTVTVVGNEHQHENCDAENRGLNKEGAAE